MLQTQSVSDRKRKLVREFDKELVELISARIEDSTQKDIADAVMKVIENDDDLVLYLTRPKLWGVLYERVGEILRARTGRMRRKLVRLVTAQATTPNHMTPQDFRTTASDLLFNQHFAGKPLTDWTFGEIGNWGSVQMKKGETMVLWGKAAIRISELGKADAHITRRKADDILAAITELGLSVEDLPKT